MWVLVLVMVLEGYGSNENRLSVWDEVDWVVSRSNCKNLHQRLLPTMHQFSEPER